MEITNWLITLFVLFLFFGGLVSFFIAIAYNALTFEKDSKFAFVLGLLSSGGASYLYCQGYAWGGIRFPFLETAIAIIISLATFSITARLFRKNLPKFFSE